MPSVFVFHVGAASSLSSRTLSVGSIGWMTPIFRCRNFAITSTWRTSSITCEPAYHF
jgi:hypothetical protein